MRNLTLSPAKLNVIYLDHNATTPIAPEVLEAMMPYLTSEWGNPSSTYAFGAKLKTAVETARAQVAELIGAQPLDIVFTCCATETCERNCCRWKPECWNGANMERNMRFTAN